MKYISVALWPVAWALGNAFACSILISVMKWVAEVSKSTLTALDPKMVASIDPTTAGYLAGAAGAMSWGLLHLVVLVIALASLLIIASAIGAPVALTATITKGACFASAQLREAASTAATIASAAATGGSSLALAPASAGIASSGASAFANLASRASSSMSGAASRLAPMAALGGPGGMIASMGVSALSRASSTIGGWASSDEGSAGDSGSSPAVGPAVSTPMMMAQLGGSSGASLPAFDNTPMKTITAVARNYRRNAPLVDG